MSRKAKSIRNMKYAIIGQIITVIASFIARTIFIRYLSVEYLGLNGLFSNILRILSISELGVGAAIGYFLYKPLSKNDEKSITNILRYFRKIYFRIGLFILLTGISLTPFLNLFIKDIPQIEEIQYIYVLFVIKTSVVYFFTYNRILLISDQKRYIDLTYTYVSASLVYTLQSIVLVLTQNYLLFLYVNIIVVVLENIMVSKRVKILYPYISNNSIGAIDHKQKKEIYSYIKVTFKHKIGTLLIDGTDNLLISMLSGLTTLGLYSNYALITNTLNKTFLMFFHSINASVGNMGASKKKSYVYMTFQYIDFFGFWMYSFSSVCLFVLLNPFIELWIGKDFSLSFISVIIICLNFYMQGQRRSLQTFRSSLGLLTHEKYKPFIEAVLNILISALLGLKLGLIGVLLGTLLSYSLSSLWIEPYTLYRHGFAKNVVLYYQKYFSRLAITFIMTYLSYVISTQVQFDSILGFMIKCIICLLVPNITLLLVYRKNEHLLKVISIILGLIKKGFKGDQ